MPGAREGGSRLVCPRIAIAQKATRNDSGLAQVDRVQARRQHRGHAAHLRQEGVERHVPTCVEHHRARRSARDNDVCGALAPGSMTADIGPAFPLAA
jgi:hypothetical protein